MYACIYVCSNWSIPNRASGLHGLYNRRIPSPPFVWSAVHKQLWQKFILQTQLLDSFLYLARLYNMAYVIYRQKWLSVILHIYFIFKFYFFSLFSDSFVWGSLYFYKPASISHIKSALKKILYPHHVVFFFFLPLCCISLNTPTILVRSL